MPSTRGKLKIVAECKSFWNILHIRLHSSRGQILTQKCTPDEHRLLGFECWLSLLGPLFKWDKNKKEMITKNIKPIYKDVDNWSFLYVFDITINIDSNGILVLWFWNLSSIVERAESWDQENWVLGSQRPVHIICHLLLLSSSTKWKWWALFMLLKRNIDTQKIMCIITNVRHYKWTSTDKYFI